MTLPCSAIHTHLQEEARRYDTRCFADGQDYKPKAGVGRRPLETILFSNRPWRLGRWAPPSPRCTAQRPERGRGPMCVEKAPGLTNLTARKFKSEAPVGRGGLHERKGRCLRFQLMCTRHAGGLVSPFSCSCFRLFLNCRINFGALVQRSCLVCRRCQKCAETRGKKATTRGCELPGTSGAG